MFHKNSEKAVVLMMATIIVGLSIYSYKHLNSEKDTKPYKSNINKEVGLPNAAVDRNLRSNKEETAPVINNNSVEEYVEDEELYGEYIYDDPDTPVENDYILERNSLSRLSENLGLDASRSTSLEGLLISHLDSIENIRNEKRNLLSKDNVDETYIASLDNDMALKEKMFSDELKSSLTAQELENFKKLEISSIDTYRKKNFTEISDHISTFIPLLTNDQKNKISSLIDSYSASNYDDYFPGVTLINNNKDTLSGDKAVEYYQSFKEEFKLLLNSKQKEAFESGRSFY